MMYRSPAVLLVLLALISAGAATPAALQGQEGENAIPVPAPRAMDEVGLAARDGSALPFPGALEETAPLPPLTAAADLRRRLEARERFTPKWLYVGIGAGIGGAIGFALAAPSCLDGSRDCGNRTLTYALIGTLTGGVAGLAVGMAADR